jgi:hypothetical protein
MFYTLQDVMPAAPVVIALGVKTPKIASLQTHLMAYNTVNHHQVLPVTRTGKLKHRVLNIIQDNNPNPVTVSCVYLTPLVAPLVTVALVTRVSVKVIPQNQFVIQLTVGF